MRSAAANALANCSLGVLAKRSSSTMGMSRWTRRWASSCAKADLCDLPPAIIRTAFHAVEEEAFSPNGALVVEEGGLLDFRTSRG
jgi:hypothetical protein